MNALRKLFLGVVSASLLATGFVSCDNGTLPGPTETTEQITQPDLLDVDANSPASSWAFVTYSLSDFAGKDVTIEFTADIAANSNETDTIDFMWQVNNDGSYPEVATFSVAPGESTIAVSGSNADPITIASSALLYLSTNNSTYDITFDITNIRYSVTYGGGDEEEPPAIEYPTDIFTVADSVIADFTTTKLFDGSNASDIVYNTDGTVTFTASATGSGGGAVFYINNDHSVINISNYESIDIEVVVSPVTGSWNPSAQKPSLGFRLYGTDASGFWNGFEDIAYFGLDDNADYGTATQHIEIDADWIETYVDSNDNDDMLAFAFKFNAYERGNDDSDRLRVQIKKVQFNKIEGTPADAPTDDGLEEGDYGTVVQINYPTQDYLVKAAGGEKVEYNKPAWVYLPAGYDPEDTDTKYPILVLMHGFQQNQNTWGLTDQGTGGKIKGYMDRGMHAGTVAKFILVVPTGVASASWQNGSGTDIDAFGEFGGELRDDLIPYMEANYNVRTDRDGRAMAGLSMGGGQTFNIGIGECLDMFSYFGAFSAATFSNSETYMASVDAKEEFDGLKIHQLYMICGDADTLVWGGFQDFVAAMPNWARVEEFAQEVYEGGTHDFPVWYRGFKHLIPLLFK